ncbi:MAG: endolytic transglycosylase MltG [Candidatus Adlerbacteria bacterium]|nr:endolytic transglycosylase MltG [Candidatus Adlerbacteria bacterium]
MVLTKYLLKRLSGFARRRSVGWTLVAILSVLLVYGIFFASPLSFPIDSYMRVVKGSTAADIAVALKEQNLIRSVVVFEVMVRLYGDTEIMPGEYYFARPQSVLKIARRVTSGDFDVEPIKITVPEGTSVRGITELLKEVPDFDTQAFYELAQDKEGRLFPDTYFILPGEDPALVLQRFEDNFKAQVTQTQVALAVSAFGRPFEEVVVMASLLEKEANNSRDRRLIAGILWSRIELGIPLQVDAVFPYIIGKGSHNLSRADLRTDSPYNTYTNKGLPPGAITNPGLSAILDAVTPIETDYLFYLADRGGTTHYSVTYEQHLNNRAKYLGS